MAKYLLLKHYRGAPAAVNDVPMDRWSPDEVEAHIRYMNDFAARLEGTGEFIDGQALSPDGMWVRSDGEGRPPVTDGPFAETKDLIAGWMVIDVDSYERAIELAGELSAAPGAGRSRDGLRPSPRARWAHRFATPTSPRPSWPVPATSSGRGSVDPRETVRPPHLRPERGRPRREMRRRRSRRV